MAELSTVQKIQIGGGALLALIISLVFLPYLRAIISTAQNGSAVPDNVLLGLISSLYVVTCVGLVTGVIYRAVR